MTDRAQAITLDDPLGSEPEGWRPDLQLPSLFLIAAAVILGIINPIHIAFAGRPIETVVATALASAPVVWGLIKGNVPAVMAGSGLLLGLVGLCLLTQPHALGVPLSNVWPLRALLLLLVAGSWAFILRPPMWVRRALAGLALTLIPVVVCAGGPLVLAQIAPVQPAPTPLFSPYWLATDSAGRLYATASQGGAILVFSSDGVPLGTFRPHLASEIGSGTSGFRPVGFPTPTPELYRTGTQLGQPVHPPFTFCGLAIDARDRLYVVDPSNLSLLRMRLDGTVEKRIAMPDGFQGARGCLAADDSYVYVASRYGIVYILDYEGRIVREVEVIYLPFSIAADGKGNLFVVASDHMDRVDVATGDITRLENPPPLPGGARAPFQALVVTQDGELLVNDLANARVLRIAPEGGALLGTIGQPGAVSTGFFPGQFGGLGGLAQDREGRIYVADWQLGVIQRFSSAGDLQEVLSAPGEAPPPVAGEEEE